jgi:epoxyqueuosine reductase
MTPAARAARARAIALEAGFDLAGVASAAPPPELAFFAEWIARGHAGEMAYLTSQREKRSSVRAAFPWARTVLSVALQYDTPAA